VRVSAGWCTHTRVACNVSMHCCEARITACLIMPNHFVDLTRVYNAFTIFVMIKCEALNRI